MAKSHDPMTVTDKQIRRAQNAVPDYISGVDGVQDSPMEAAAAKPEKMLQGVTEAVTSGRWAAGLRSVSLDDWKKLTKEKGGQRFAQGIAAARDKILQFQQAFQPFVAGVASKINQMPDTTMEDRIQKMVANAREMAKFQKPRNRR